MNRKIIADVAPPVRTRSRVGVALLGLVLGLSIAQPSRPQAYSSVVNGLGELGEPTTGALIEGAVPEDGFITCSATLIGCDMAISSAHCFNSNLAEKKFLFFQHRGFVEIESATRQPDYENLYSGGGGDYFAITRQDDIAVIKLVEPVTGITPSPIATSAIAPPTTPGVKVGFGRDPTTEATSFDQNAGIKRSGTLTLASCQAPLDVYDVLCWDPAIGTRGEDVSTCNVDSGGPLFVDDGGTAVVAGITRGAIFDPMNPNDLCIPPVQPYDVSLLRHAAWIQSEFVAQGAVPIATTQCSALPQVSTDSVATACAPLPAWDPSEPPRICGFEGALASGGSVDYAFDVAADTDLLVVAMNGYSDASPDSNFYVKAGGTASPLDYDCAVTGAGSVGACEFATPQSGSWSVHVEELSDDSEHQISVTQYPPASAVAAPGLGPAGLGLLAAALARFALRASADRRPRR